MEEKILSVLEEVNEEIISYEGDNLLDDGILDSIQVIDLVSELEDALDIVIDAKLVVEDNFKTKQAIIDMVMRIIED